jgi:hypothetical protein
MAAQRVAAMRWSGQMADGHPDAERTADLLVALKDGLLVGADLDDPARQSLIRDAVARLLDGAGRG